MEAIRQTIVDVELTKKLHRVYSGVLLAKQDKQANRMGANVFQDGEAVNLSGYTVKGYFIRNGNETIVIEDGAIIGNQAYVELPGNCYFYDGSYTLTIKLCQGGQELALVIFDGQVGNTITDAVVENEHVINVQDFMQMDWLNRVETAAETALEQAAIATEAATAAEEAWNGVKEGLAQVAPCILVDASGDMVTITDGAEMPVQNLITHIEPQADGSGWDEVSANRTGKNLANLFDFSHTQSTVVTTAKDGIVTMNGTAASSASTSILLWKSTLKPGTYTLSHKVLSGSMEGAAEAASVMMGGGVRTRLNAPAATFTVEEESEFNFSIVRATSAVTYDHFTFSVQLECGDTATDFEPPNMQTLTAALPETMTDGIYDWINGTLTKADGSTVQLEKQQLSTLKGTNNIWSDAGATEVTYVADTKLYIDNKIAAIAAAIV